MEIEGIGTQLYVWGQVFGREGRSLDAHLDEALAQVAAAGFDGAEGSLSWTADAPRARAVAAAYRRCALRIPSLYHGGPYHSAAEAERTVAETLRLAAVARDLGCPAVNVNPNPIGRDKKDDELRTQAEHLNRLGAGLSDLGMELYIHNHDPEIRNNAREFRANAALTDPSLVRFCVDTHWVYRGGGDPVELLREVVERTRSLHIRNSERGVWSESLGDGDVDYAAVRAVLDAGRFRGWLLVELAYEGQTRITRPLVENARLAREYMRAVFGR
jgi:inosose dehydratase